VNSLLAKQSDKAQATSSEGEGFLVLNQNGVRTIKLNRPEKKNALTLEVYICVLAQGFVTQEVKPKYVCYLTTFFLQIIDHRCT
jgi:hypothetical protein